jgi:hypothetical protein
VKVLALCLKKMTSKTLEKELNKEMKSALNRALITGTEERFVKMIDFLERSNYNTSHYKQTYQKAVNYLERKKEK